MTESIHLMARKGDLEGIKKKLDDGEDINVKDNDGFTPLHWAVDRKHVNYDIELPSEWRTDEQQVEVIKFLLTNGANVNAESKNEITTLHLAAWHGYAAFAKELCIANVDVNASDYRGNTPLHIAVGQPGVYPNTIHSYNARVMMKRKELLRSYLIKTNKLPMCSDTKRIVFENCLPKEMRPLRQGTSIYDLDNVQMQVENTTVSSEAS